LEWTIKAGEDEGIFRRRILPRLCHGSRPKIFHAKCFQKELVLREDATWPRLHSKELLKAGTENLAGSMGITFQEIGLIGGVKLIPVRSGLDRRPFTGMDSSESILPSGK
jgi:hypothetical protein